MSTSIYIAMRLFILTNIKRSSSTCHSDTWSMGHSCCGCDQGVKGRTYTVNN